MIHFDMDLALMVLEIRKTKTNPVLHAEQLLLQQLFKKINPWGCPGSGPPGTCRHLPRWSGPKIRDAHTIFGPWGSNRIQRYPTLDHTTTGYREPGGGSCSNIYKDYAARGFFAFMGVFWKCLAQTKLLVYFWTNTNYLVVEIEYISCSIRAPHQRFFFGTTLMRFWII